MFTASERMQQRKPVLQKIAKITLVASQTEEEEEEESDIEITHESLEDLGI